MSQARRGFLGVLSAVLTALGLMVIPTAASAATGDVGWQDQSFSGANNPTADKPQSKLWYVNGVGWFADMYDPSTTDWYIFQLNQSTHTWAKTTARVDDRPNTSADALWDGTYLYIGTHQVRSASQLSSNSAPMRLYRYSWDGSKFTLNTGFPKTISTNSSESLTIDKDSTGTVWATWTKVTTKGTPGAGQVYVNYGTGNGSTWGTPFVMPTTGGLNNSTTNPNVAQDDISALVHFSNKIGVMWSNQKDNTVYWSVHTDNTPTGTWTGGYAARSPKISDDHLNIKSLQSDTQGRVYAAVKTSLDHLSGHLPTDPQINLMVYKPGTGPGTWSTTTFGRIKDCHTRAQVVLDSSNQKVYVFATGTQLNGTCTSTGDGTIYYKVTSMDNPSFADQVGEGTVALHDQASDLLNNVTTTKQDVTNASGLVILAGNQTTKQYWHNEYSLGSTPPPTDTTAPSVPSGVTATADSATQVTVNWTASTDNVGVASYQVTRNGSVVASAVTSGTSFVDTSVQASTSYSYTVSAVDAAGNRSAESAAAPVTTPPGSTPPPTGSGVTVGAHTTAGSGGTAGTAVSLTTPSDMQNGDVLIAQVNADLNPTMTAPSGWTAVKSQAVSTRAKVFVYSHVVTDVSTEPASYSWTLSTAVTWNGGITNFHGVNTTSLWDVAPTTVAAGSTGTTSFTLPSVTTLTDGAVVVGGVGINSSGLSVTQPSGWTEAFESTGGQVTEMATLPMPSAGATGTATFTLGGSTLSAGWIGALKPAA